MPAGISYNHQTVTLGEEAFVDCEFTSCRLVYSGEDAPKIEGCRFVDCEWKFEGAAARTLTYLKLMWSVGATSAVQAIIKEITVARR